MFGGFFSALNGKPTAGKTANWVPWSSNSGGDIVFCEQAEALCPRELSRRHFRQHRVTIEQYDPRLEFLLGPEIGIARRIERLDKSDLFDGQESFPESDDVFHVTSRVMSVDVWSARYLKIFVTLDGNVPLGMRA
jgi:hypothetical protein